MKRVIVGTAGHIDHGKTRLIEALTGTDCDRWAEEKERGITIDLGFAHLEQDDLRVGFVDVPGHERFLHNALAGLGGIRIMLLVVAADEGVKPQTREHLAICTLLGIPAAAVALTKIDLVEKDLVDLAQLEIEELLADTPFAKAAVYPVSSTQGNGVPELRHGLLELAGRHHVEPLVGPARLPVDRTFLLQGLGLVVTGTLISGEIRPGDILERGPGGPQARVRGVQVHDRAADVAVAGERTALQLTGIEHRALARGDQLLTPGAFATSRKLVARFHLLADAPKGLTGSTDIRFHLLAGTTGARIRALEPRRLEPGDTGLVEIRLAAPAPMIPGDRFIVRRPSPPATLGGGTVLDTAWRPRRGKALAAALPAVQVPEELLRLWVEQEGEAGIATAPLAQRLGRSAEILEPALEALAQKQRLLAVPAGSGHGQRWLAPAAYRRVKERAERVLATYFRKERLAEAMPKAEAVERIFPGRAAELADVYLDWLGKQQVLSLSGGKITLPGRTAELSSEETGLAAKILQIFDGAGLEPPSPAALRGQTRAKPQILDGLLSYLIDQRRLLRLPGGLIIASSAVDKLTRDLETAQWREFSVADFKKKFGLTRKWAIPLLEQLDSTGVTRRVGDRRQLVGR